ncbi:DNA polymerase I [Patescibacteria group bacterium]|nr:DNA polymerase I [Patescibacteria group bacterium]MBU1890550.1 DNA polymerase I [Patescibacteria group bacterium]
MTTKKDRFMIIDGNALIHRAWHAIPPLITKDGTMVNAVFGFTSILLKVLKEFKPKYVAVAYDVKKKTFRHKEYADYKASRIKQPQEFYDQIPITKKVVEALSIPIYEQEGYEADDVIGTLTVHKEVDKASIETIVVTGDLDALQLVDQNTKVFTLRKGFSDTVTYDTDTVNERYGLRPEQIVDFKALSGDSSDNIPGVKGIGKQSATSLLQVFGSLEKVYQAISKNDKQLSKFRPRVIELLKADKANAKLSQRLATIVKDVPIKFQLEQSRSHSYDRDEAIALFQELEFKSLITRLPSAETQGQLLFTTKKADIAPIKRIPGYHLVNNADNLKKFIVQLKRQKAFAVDTETNSLDTIQGSLLGISISWRAGEAYYLDLKSDQTFRQNALSSLKPVLERSEIKKYGQNLKFDIAILEKAGISLNGVDFDTMIASYLLNPSVRQHNLNALAFNELNHEMIPIEQLIGKKGKSQLTMEEVPMEDLSQYACEDADYTYQLVAPLRKRLTEKHLSKLFSTIELPLIKVLALMEKHGVLIDAQLLSQMSRDSGKKISALEKKIYKEAGEEFNINSPLQLKKIFFDKLDIDTEGVGMTKTGYSTAATELEKMHDAHPIVPLIIEYRELSKLKSTYIDALPELINPQTGHVHTSFNQTITATGRLSSSNPNFQNIPIRTPLGREIRKAFIASPGFQILAADYSQIELRVVASIANDKSMLDAFRNDEDIHARTAAEIHGCELEDVSKDMRRHAKTINFGILYGMGTYGLARSAKMEVSEASDYIETYFDHHEGIRKYIEQTKALARKMGYVETLFGRRRYLPEIISGIRQVRASAERMAINMPVQGTAADLIKLAMIEIHRELPTISPKTKMILQVHDELVFEVPKAELKKVAKFIKEKMEGIYKLHVPIKVDIEAGRTWGNLSQIK